MTGCRLLPHKDLIALLCRRAYGESIDSLAAAYLLKRHQVAGLLNHHGKIIQQMFRFLTITPKTIRASGASRPCKQCTGSIWTHSNREIHICDWCKALDANYTAWRGLG